MNEDETTQHSAGGRLLKTGRRASRSGALPLPSCPRRCSGQGRSWKRPERAQITEPEPALCRQRWLDLPAGACDTALPSRQHGARSPLTTYIFGFRNVTGLADATWSLPKR